MNAETARKHGTALETIGCLSHKIESSTANRFEVLQYDEAVRTVRSRTFAGKLKNLQEDGAIQGKSFVFEVLLKLIALSILLGLLWVFATILEGSIRALPLIATML